ncbi:glycosyltransferase, partial [Pseudomonas viridiflava]|uniref:glycosyltransferase n=1 Tax=Pseudomonas viridiflava TaxID=33069 RepID=UPI001980BA5B
MVIPCFNVRKHINDVINSIGKEVDRIYVVDDCCPERSGKEVEQHCRDARVVILFNTTNLGVGGAVMAGYAAA